MHVLEDRKPRHQPRRQRRVAGLVGIDRAEPRLEKTPVDRPAKLRQRVIEVDDLVEPGPEKIVCPLSRRSLGRIESPSAKPTERQNHDRTSGSICKKASRQTPLTCKCNDLPIPGNASKIRPLRIVHGRLITLRLLGGVAVSVIVGVIASKNVNINRFSLHAVYRNRLVRGYLGRPVRREIRIALLASIQRTIYASTPCGRQGRRATGGTLSASSTSSTSRSTWSRPNG